MIPKPPFLVVVFSVAAICCAVIGARAGEPEQKFEAIIKTQGGDSMEAYFRQTHGATRRVTTRARNFYDARDAIESQYCPERGCIVEGPWTVK